MRVTNVTMVFPDNLHFLFFRKIFWRLIVCRVYRVNLMFDAIPAKGIGNFIFNPLLVHDFESILL
jgi:hypothetical protein